MVPGCLLLLLAAGCGPVADSIKKGLEAKAKEKKQAATAKEAVEFYAEACKNKDIPVLLRLLHTTPRKVVSASCYPASTRAGDEYAAALDAKFGKDPETPRSARSAASDTYRG
jgi:hypothetical protein